MRSKLIILTMVFLMLLSITGLAGCNKATASPQPSTPPSGTAPARTFNPTNLEARPINAPQQASTAPASPTATIRGDGTVTVATYANLYFGSGGQITTINVKLGDHVTKGTVLAKLDVTSLEAALAQAKVNLDQAKLSQTQAESALASAQFNLDKTQAVNQIKDAITNAEWTIKAAQVNLDQAKAADDMAAINTMTTYIANAQKEMDNQQRKLSALLGQDEYSGTVAYDILGQTYDRLTVEDAQTKELALENAQQTVDKSQDTITQAQKNVDVAQQQLDQATITAPFDGLVAVLNQNVGDVVSTPSQSQHPIIYLIDPTTKELNIGVNELDISKVKIGQKAIVNIDAFSNTKIDGQVASISPSPTVQGGVVDYVVTITFSVPSTTDVRIGMNGSASIPIN